MQAISTLVSCHGKRTGCYLIIITVYEMCFSDIFIRLLLSLVGWVGVGRERVGLATLTKIRKDSGELQFIMRGYTH